MAAVTLSPAQHKLGSMTNRRVPLGNVPNGANSPFRTATKRSRDQVDAHGDFPWDLQPSIKRQAYELERPPARTSPRKHGLPSAEGRVFNIKKPSGTPPTTFERQLLALKEGKPQQRVERQERSTEQAVKGIKQWQEHYRRAFPSFVFYFENIGEETRIKCAKYARSLGAREEKFFSKDVTHVITLRDIPTEVEIGEAADAASASSASTSSQITKPSTINPSVLDRANDNSTQTGIAKTRFTFEASTNRRVPATNIRDVEQRRTNASNTDVLVKAKEMGIKVWQLEKFQRMIRTMHETPAEAQTQQNARSKTLNGPVKGHREPELSRMLRNERINGPSDRDSTTTVNETINFKGPYIYIRDMDERTKPILVREYPKPARGEMGAWPQFQAVTAGRCPFVPEITKEDVEKVSKPRETEAQQQQKAANSRSVPVTRSALQREETPTAAPAETSRRVPLQESPNAGNATRLPPTPPQKDKSQEFCPPPLVANKNLSSVQIQKAVEAQAKPPQRLFGGEPAASGLQQSNITSAIRSQMISSTAAQPGAKAGTSKEFHGLQRKVLEKNTAPNSHTTTQARHPVPNLAATNRSGREIPNQRQTRMQVQQVARQKVEQHKAESTESEGEGEGEDVWLAEGVRKTGPSAKKPSQQGKEAKAGPKLGYCENCKEKYDDFDEHIVGRKHRKFALTKENWADLDRLLSHLGRKLKEPDSQSF